VPRCS